MMLGIVFGIFLVAMILALPMGVAMGVATVVPQLINSSFAGNMNYIIQAMISGLNTTPILAIPLFMLSGALMTRGGIAKKLFDVFAYIVGKRTAGIPCAVVLTCLFYGAISGSGPATAAAVGAMCIPILVDLGYDKVFSAAIVATAGGLGVIIPPSIPFIMYGLFTGTSVGDMFTAGILPGFLIAICIMFYCWLYCKRNGEDKQKVAENYHQLKEQGFWKVFKTGFWAVLTPVIILGGIYGGIVTPTEAACVSVFYALIVCLFIYKTIKIKDIPLLLKDSIASYAPLLLCIALAQGFSRILVLLKASTYVQNLLTTFVNSKFTLLIILIIFLLILGMFMDCGPAVMILAPIVLPVAEAYGVDAVHLGIIMVTALAVGFVTPPFGMNLFVTAPIVGVPVAKLGQKALPFIATFIVALLLIAFIPQISLILL
ncbi:MAG: TRAP transporter large permease [Lachnospiraceae bacterium]|nr:TRAP transporter large permease [Lachnospiraceae bacterium]